MSFLTNGRKVDLINLALELNETVPPDIKVIDLRNIIMGSENYEESFVKGLLDMVIEDREKAEKERKKEKAEREREREKAKAEFELEKVRLQNFNIKTESNHTNIDPWHVRQLMQKFEIENGDITFFLILFERQVRLISLDKERWVSRLLGLLPYEITKLIAHEPKEKVNNYNHVKDYYSKDLN
ncbi:uncharacterized protein TNIN_153131 [Trichonephila inaurata madagascariensis]|uniref:Uncharacterized protein n=1 Tax=Trichonephila inaurata madagascariensis TaxID=2747483 RepID=A0A8X7CGK6_9ARAC|nr:uncharacterized protein TNIN_153131 [Trichonephila inaurata madagascariensis]